MLEYKEKENLYNKSIFEYVIFSIKQPCDG